MYLYQFTHKMMFINSFI